MRLAVGELYYNLLTDILSRAVSTLLRIIGQIFAVDESASVQCACSG